MSIHPLPIPFHPINLSQVCLYTYTVRIEEDIYACCGVQWKEHYRMR